MRKSPTEQELDLLVGITMGALPDSFTQRKAALVTLLYLLPRSYGGRSKVGQALSTLHAHDQVRFQFAQGGAK